MFLLLIVSISLLTWSLIHYIIETRTLIVFCDVGQGDAAYLRISNRIDVLIDAGPDDKVLTCLGKYMPFYDRTIELAFLSHPHADHYGGFIKLKGRYKIKTFFRSDIEIHSPLYNKMIKQLIEEKTDIKSLYLGDTLEIIHSRIQTFWPDKSFIEIAHEKDDLNALSQVLLFSQDKTHILFTGDINPDIQKRLLQQPIPKVYILKVPHHGSTKGLTVDFLKLADPLYSVISVGRHNRYHHPHAEILNMLADFGTQIRRTDEVGDVVFNL